MRNILLPAMLLIVSVSPALAASYPVSGKWGQTSTSDKGPVDCSRLRVISFNGDTRTDSNGGVPAYRIKSIAADGSSYRIVDEFTTGQIRNGSVKYTLRQADGDRLELNMQPGGLIKLQRCK